MKKIVYLMAFSAMAAGTACSRIDANTSNTVPTSDAYAATVTATHSGAGTAVTTPAAVPAATNVAAGTMLYGARVITEASFLMEAASASMMEIRLGNLALERSSHAGVKKFGQMMVNDHTKAYRELREIANGMNVTLPTSLMPEHQKLVDELSMLTGDKFDEEYIDEIEEAHERSIGLYEVVSNGGQTTSVRAYAIRMLPVLRSHEHKADELEEKVD